MRAGLIVRAWRAINSGTWPLKLTVTGLLHMHFGNRRSVLATSAVVLCSATSASEFAEAQAIDLVRAATVSGCTESTPCTFQAQRANGRWTVIVEHTKRDSPTDQPLPYKGGREVFVLDDHGKIVLALRQK
jgi:hypothetical protein